MKRRLFIALSALSLGMCLVTAVTYFIRSWGNAVAEVTDPGQYQTILRDLGYPTPTKLNVPTLGHFPATIPSNATNVRFFFRPHVLQGGTQMQLRVSVPSEQVAAVLEAVKPAAKEVQTGGDMFDALNEHGGLPSSMFRDGANGAFAPLPKEFQVFVLDAKASSQSGWDKGYSYGVAVNEKEGEVIYWIEDW